MALTLLTQFPPALIHPFSRLTQLMQQKVIASLSYHDEGFSAGTWRATVTVHSETNGTALVGKGAGLSKAVAKKLAAGVVLGQIQCDSPTGPDSGYSSESADAVAVDISLQRTARQHAVLERAHVHLSVLNNMARERVTNTTPSLFLSIDLEVYNGQHDILEVGLAWIFGHQVWQCTDRPLPVECHHLVIKENAHLHNHGTYDQREKFVYGDSRLISESAILETLARLLPPVVFTECPVYLIGHTIQNDVKWLNHADVDLFKLIPHLTVCDIGRAWQAMRDEPQSTGLGRMLDHAGCQHPHTHNAGNDARYSIDICLKMMEELAAAADLSVCETPLL